MTLNLAKLTAVIVKLEADAAARQEQSAQADAAAQAEVDALALRLEALPVPAATPVAHDAGVLGEIVLRQASAQAG